MVRDRLAAQMVLDRANMPRRATAGGLDSGGRAMSRRRTFSCRRAISGFKGLVATPLGAIIFVAGGSAAKYIRITTLVLSPGRAAS